MRPCKRVLPDQLVQSVHGNPERSITVLRDFLFEEAIRINTLGEENNHLEYVCTEFKDCSEKTLYSDVLRYPYV